MWQRNQHLKNKNQQARLHYRIYITYTQFLDSFPLPSPTHNGLSRNTRDSFFQLEALHRIPKHCKWIGYQYHKQHWFVRWQTFNGCLWWTCPQDLQQRSTTFLKKVGLAQQLKSLQWHRNQVVDHRFGEVQDLANLGRFQHFWQFRGPWSLYLK